MSARAVCAPSGMSRHKSALLSGARTACLCSLSGNGAVGVTVCQASVLRRRGATSFILWVVRADAQELLPRRWAPLGVHKKVLDRFLSLPVSVRLSLPCPTVANSCRVTPLDLHCCTFLLFFPFPLMIIVSCKMARSVPRTNWSGPRFSSAPVNGSTVV